MASMDKQAFSTYWLGLSVPKARSNKFLLYKKNNEGDLLQQQEQRSS